MTPMVDLAFLLLTFFVLAATLARPKAQEIIYPDTDTADPTPLNARNALTILLGETKDQIAYYHGMWNDSDTLLHFTTLAKE
jgi:biopolymer transport protein ExbD